MLAEAGLNRAVFTVAIGAMQIEGGNLQVMVDGERQLKFYEEYRSVARRVASYTTSRIIPSVRSPSVTDDTIMFIPATAFKQQGCHRRGHIQHAAKPYFLHDSKQWRQGLDIRASPLRRDLSTPVPFGVSDTKIRHVAVNRFGGSRSRIESRGKPLGGSGSGRQLRSLSHDFEKTTLVEPKTLSASCRVFERLLGIVFAWEYWAVG
jgi:hypothetical protein